MARINRARIRRQEAIMYRRYVKFGTRVIYKAIEETVRPILQDPEQMLDKKPMHQAFLKLYTVIGVDAAEREFTRMSNQEPVKATTPKDFFLRTWSAWMESYVNRFLGKMIVDITENTREIINKVVARGAEQGLTRTQISKEIEEATLGEIGMRRARVIARTEGQTAANEGKTRSAEDWGQQSGTNLYKLWIHGGSKESRSWHMDMDGKPPIPKDSMFSVTNPNTGITTLMSVPADVNAPAEERINCNCIVVYISERKARRDYPDLLI